MMAEGDPEVTQDERGRYDNIFGGAGTRSAAPLAGISNDGKKPSAAKRMSRGLLTWAKAAAISLGVMYLLGWAAAVGFVTAVNKRFSRISNFASTVERSAATAVTLKYRLPSDPRITPDAAGVALASLTTEPTQRPIGFTYRDIPDRPTAPWRALPIPQETFPGVGIINGVPDHNKILDQVSRPLTAMQRQALQMIGSAAIWWSYDLVARASAVDVLGGRVSVPFGDRAQMLFLPVGRSAEIRWLSQAGVSRAAWHLSEGRRDSAEYVLRGIISFGAAVVENAPLLIDQFAGTAALATGRTALIRYFTLIGDSRGATLAAETEAAVAGYTRPAVLDPISRADFAEMRRRMVAIVNARELPRALRIEMLMQLKSTSCQSFRHVAFGEDDLARTSAEALKAELARFPSERALIDLMAKPLSDRSAYDLLAGQGPGAEALANVSKLYFSPRIAGCGIGGGAFR